MLHLHACNASRALSTSQIIVQTPTKVATSHLANVAMKSYGNFSTFTNTPVSGTNCTISMRPFPCISNSYFAIIKADDVRYNKSHHLQNLLQDGCIHRKYSSRIKPVKLSKEKEDEIIKKFGEAIEKIGEEYKTTGRWADWEDKGYSLPDFDALYRGYEQEYDWPNYRTPEEQEMLNYEMEEGEYPSQKPSFKVTSTTEYQTREYSTMTPRIRVSQLRHNCRLCYLDRLVSSYSTGHLNSESTPSNEHSNITKNNAEKHRTVTNIVYHHTIPKFARDKLWKYITSDKTVTSRLLYEIYSACKGKLGFGKYLFVTAGVLVGIYFNLLQLSDIPLRYCWEFWIQGFILGGTVGYMDFWVIEKSIRLVAYFHQDKKAFKRIKYGGIKSKDWGKDSNLFSHGGIPGMAMEKTTTDTKKQKPKSEKKLHPKSEKKEVTPK